MKKILLLTILLFQMTFVSGQERDDVGHRVTSWNISRHSCFKGLEWKVRKSYYSDNSDNFINEIEIKNNYSKTITFSYEVSADSNINTTQFRKTLGPGQTTNLKRVQNVNFVYLYVAEVCFNSNNRCENSCYALCDNGTPNIPTDCSGKKTNTLSTTSTNSKPQNDLTEYNRSKADLERQLQEENTKRQQQAIQLANQKQQFINVYNEGVQLGNSGRYSEAASKYQQAIGLATNGADRQTAQNAYNKISNANTQQQALNQVSSSLTELARALDEAKEQKRLKQEQERLENLRIAEEKEQEITRLNEEMESKWNIANGYSNLNNTEGYKKAIEIMLPYETDNKLNAMAITTIGFWYDKIKDYKNAMKWYNTAYVKGDPTATRNIGVLYLNGSGIDTNKGLAITYFQKACLLNLEQGCVDFKSFRTELEKQIEKNNKETNSNIYYVAETYYTEKNYPQALKYYVLDYENNAVKSWNISSKIANMYYDKDQLNDRVLSANWYAITMNLMENDTKENINIGKRNWFDDKYTDILFNYGNSIINTDGKLAIEIYLKAVRDGYTGAYTQAGLIYELGKGGVEIDWKQAQYYYAKDAEKKAAKAMYYLGQLYEKGGPKLEKSKSESKKWYKMACKTDKKFCK